MVAAKRMAKEERRRQLLETALAIVREEGTDALTLARLAERAGVTKPIAYEHFGTREGLLIALFKAHDDRTTEAVHAALGRGPETLEDVVAIIASAYTDCVMGIGPEFGAILDALSAAEETAGFRDAWRAFLADEFRAAFAPFAKLPAKQSRALLLGLLGACEVVTDAAAAGQVSRKDAIAALTQIMLGVLRPLAA